MRVSIVQTEIEWENPRANRIALAKKLNPLKGYTDLIVLPEMFTTGFSMRPEALAESIDGETIVWMQEQSQSLNAAITGSFICRVGERYYNRLAWVTPDGTVQFYDKRHLFALAGEGEHYRPGGSKLIVEWKGFRICPLVCYDLRFPVWSRNIMLKKNEPLGRPAYDVLIYVANWPMRRNHHWKALLMARAIENQAFVIGVNIVGTDGNRLEYTGDSGIIDYSGGQICQISGMENIVTAEFSMEALNQYRQLLPFLTDGDTFTLT